MKTLKELRNNMREHLGFSTMQENPFYGSTVPHIDGGLDISGNQELITRLNEYISRQLQRDFSSPRIAFNMLRAKLNVLGLDFTIDQSVQSEGAIDFPMTRHGGAFGTTPEHNLADGFYNENGFVGNVPHSLVGNITHTPNSGFSLEAKIEPKNKEQAR